MKFIITILLLFPFLCIAQTGSVTGRITDGETPIPFSSVVLKGTNLGAISNDKGEFSIRNVPFGIYTLSVKIIGFDGYERRINIYDSKEINLNIFLNPQENTLNEVVVTGTLREVSKLESSVPVEVYSPAFFRKNPTPNIFEALNAVNGVQPQLNCNVCNTGDIHINGLEGPYTLVLIDGMPIVSALSTVYGLSGIPNSMVDRIEIVKGPGSTLYGSEAVAGIINIITKNPSSAPKFFAEMTGSNHQDLNVDLGYTVKLGNKITALGSLNVFNFVNKLDINNDNFTDITLQKRASIFTKFHFARANNRDANLVLRYYTEDRFGGELEFNQNMRGSGDVYGESIYTKRLEVIGNYRLPIAEKIDFNYSINWHNQDSFYGEIPYKGDQRIAFGQVVWDKRIGKKHELLLGAALRYTYYDDNSPATANINLENSPSITYLPGIFIQDEISLNEKNKLLLGLRYDYNSKHGSILSPRLNYKYSPNKNNIWRLSLGNGYRVVNLFTEDHAALTGAREVVVANALKPERSYNANVNYQKFISVGDGFINLDATAFYTYFSNKIIGDFETSDKQIIYDNLDGFSVSKGFSLNSNYTISSALKILAGFTLMDVYQQENKVREQLVAAPKFTGNFAISYLIQSARLSIDYTGNIYGPMRLVTVENDFRPEFSPWFSLQNVQLTQKLNNGLELFGGIKNLLNFVPKNPILRPFDPFNKTLDENNPNDLAFNPDYNYAPIQGIRGFLGLRYTLRK